MNRRVIVVISLVTIASGVVAISILWILSPRLPTAIMAQINGQPGRVSGKLIIDGKTFPLNYAHAVKRFDIRDENKHTIELTFTAEQPYPYGNRQALEALLKVVDQGKVTMVFASINEQGKVTSAGASGAGQVGQVTPVPEVSFSAIAVTDDVIEGRLYSKDPLTSSGHKIEFDLQFKTLITIDAKNLSVSNRTGKPLPPGGGEPGRAYIAEQKAEIQAIEIKLRSSAYSSKEAEMWKQWIKARRKMIVNILGGFIEGNKATLTVSETIEGEKRQAIVNMHFEDGKWKTGTIGFINNK